MPAFPSVDLSSFDLSKIDFSKIDFSNIDLPKIDFSKIDLPKIDFSNIDLPKIDLPDFDPSTIDTDRVKAVARDAAYVGIGLGVLAVQQAQVRRREIAGSVERQVRQFVDAVR